MGLRDDRQIAHTRVLFFFCDVSIILRRKLIEEDLAFEMLGVHQYSFYREYFAAILEAINEPTGLVKPPFFVNELAWFDRRYEKWKHGPVSSSKDTVPKTHSFTTDLVRQLSPVVPHFFFD